MSYTDLPEIKELYRIERQLACLSVYRDVAEDELIRSFRRFLIDLCSPLVTVEDNIITYTEIVSAIIRADIDGSFPQIIATKILESENPLNQLLARGNAAKHPLASSQLSEMAARDLDSLQALAQIHSPQIKKLLSNKAWEQKRTDLRDTIASLAIWQTADVLNPDPRKTSDYNDRLAAFTEQLQTSHAWSRLLPDLFSYHLKHGVGPLSGDYILWAKADEMKPYPFKLNRDISKLENEDFDASLASFAKGLKAQHLLLLSSDTEDLLSRMNRTVHDWAEAGMKSIYIQAGDPGLLENLLSQRLHYRQRLLLLIDAVQLESLCDREHLFYRELSMLLSRKDEDYLIIALHSLSREIKRNGTLVDCETLVADADRRMKKILRTFDHVVDLSPTEASDDIVDRKPQEKEITD